MESIDSGKKDDMAKKDAPAAEQQVIQHYRLERLTEESKNYAKFGVIPQDPALENKPGVLMGNDGKVYVSKKLVNGGKAITITVTVEK